LKDEHVGVFPVVLKRLIFVKKFKLKVRNYNFGFSQTFDERPKFSFMLSKMELQSEGRPVRVVESEEIG